MIPAHLAKNLAILYEFTVHDPQSSLRNGLAKSFTDLTLSQNRGSPTPWWNQRMASMTDDMTYECSTELGNPSEVDCTQIEWNQLSPPADSVHLDPGNPIFLHSSKHTIAYIIPPCSPTNLLLPSRNRYMLPRHLHQRKPRPHLVSNPHRALHPHDAVHAEPCADDRAGRPCVLRTSSTCRSERPKGEEEEQERDGARRGWVDGAQRVATACESDAFPADRALSERRGGNEELYVDGRAEGDVGGGVSLRGFLVTRNGEWEWE